MSDEEFQFRTRCQFNAYCKKTIVNKANEFKRNSSKRWKNERFLEEIPTYEQEAIQTEDDVLKDRSTYYSVKGKLIPKNVLHEAIESLPEKKHSVILLYYFDELNDVEIGRMLNLSQRVANYRRNSALAAIEKYLEEQEDE